MNTLPPFDNLRIEKLTAIFGNTTNSYKYIWFLAILESLSVQILAPHFYIFYPSPPFFAKKR